MEMVKRVKEFFTKDKEVKEIKRQMDNIRISPIALESYRVFVRGNQDLDENTLTLKLKRNWLIGSTTSRKANGYERRCLGNLIIHSYNIDGVTFIKALYNRKGSARAYVINEELKEKINKIYNL